MSATPNALLIVKPGSFGDIIHALPCAAAIKAARPQTRLSWLVDERWQVLLEGNPHVDETIVFPRQRFRGLRGKIASLPWALDLRRLKPDTVLDLQGLLRSALMARLSGARRIIGLTDAREGARFFFSETIPVSPGEHAVLRYLRALAPLGIPAPSRPEFPLPPGTLPALGKTGAPFVLLHPFARGAGKSLTDQQVFTLCQALHPLRVVVVGMGNAISLPNPTVNLLNRTSIPELIGLIRQANFVISVDSGPMHIAAALDIPLLSLHTWSDPRLVGPFRETAWIWQGGEIRPQNLTEKALPPARIPDDCDILKIADFVKSLPGPA